MRGAELTIMRFSCLHHVLLVVTILILDAVQPSASVTDAGTTLTTPTATDTITLLATTLEPCDPIRLLTCPEDIHKLVSPRELEGTIVSWETPQLEPTQCVVSETTSEIFPKSFFGVGTTPVWYLFHNLNGDQMVYCNFTVNITPAQCIEGESICFTSGRCITSDKDCDSYPDCPDKMDENRQSCQPQEKCVTTRDKFLDSCSTKARFQSTVEEIPRRKRQITPSRADLTPPTWRFTTDDRDNTFITNVGLRIYDLSEVVERDFPAPVPAEFEIRIRTSVSLHDLTIYEAAYGREEQRSQTLITRLRQPLEVKANENVTITLAYTTDPLNEPAKPLYLESPCPFCVELNGRVFDMSTCDDDTFLTCLNNFHILNISPSCATDEELQLYSGLYGNQCLRNPEFVHITSDQQLFPGEAVDLVCAVDGLPIPMVWWIDDTNDVRSQTTLSNSVIEVSSEGRFFCKYESSKGSGISEAVVVKHVSEFCDAQFLSVKGLLNTEDKNTCARTEGLRSYPRVEYVSPNQNTFLFRFYLREDQLTSDGTVAFALSVSTDIFFGTFPGTGTPISSFELSITEIIQLPQRKRGITPRLYSTRYDYVNILPSSKNFVVFPLDPPVKLGVSDSNSDFFEISVLLTPIQWSPPFGTEFGGEGYLNITECANAEYSRGELQVDCDRFYQNWTDIIGAASSCNLNTVFYEAYQKCIGDASDPPIIISEPKSKTVAFSPPGNDFPTEEELTCFIDNAVRLQWFRLDTPVVASVGNGGNVLRFRVELADQGSYFCTGYGGGVYSNVQVNTTSATLVIEGASTFVASVHFPELEFTEDLQLSLRDSTGRGFRLSNDIRDWYFRNIEQQIRTAVLEASGANGDGDYSGIAFGFRDGYSQYPPGGPPGGPPPVASDTSIRAFLPIEDSAYTRAELILYIIGSAALIPDNLLNDTLADILMEYLGSLSQFTEEPINNATTVLITNIGSCPEDETNNPYLLTWPQTQVNEVAESTEKCPEFSGIVSPRGTRTCEGDLVSAPGWGDVIINECFGEGSNEINSVLSELSHMPVTSENVTQVSSDLAEATNKTGINATGLIGVALTLESIIEVESPSPEVTKSVIETIDNILNIENEVFEDAVEENVPTRILRSLEEQLTSLQKQGKNFTVKGTNIDVKAVQIPQSNIQNGLGFANIVRSSLSVIFSDPDDILVEETDTSIALPPEIVTRFREQINETAMVPASFVLYQNSKLFQSSRLMDESTAERVRIVGTRVISATIEGLKVDNLPPSQPVVSTYLHKESEDENTTLENFECVFWDFNLENGKGDWSNEGCQLVVASSTDRSICHCDHLTSFAVLIDVHGQKYSTLVLDVLSKIGCGISITALIITLITYLAIKSLRAKTPKQILICLSFTLLCLYIVFVAGIDSTNSYGGCIFVAALLHYLTLSSVSWMGVEAVNLYLLVVKVFNADVSHFMLKASLAAWGVPLVPVIIVLAVDSSQYVNVHHCFMQPSYAFYFADLLLIFLILIFNLVLFVMIIYKLTCGRKDISRSSSRDKSQSVTRAVNAIAISAILGLTWIFGFLTIFENQASSLAFQVLFCIFNSLQGFFIFLLFCVRPEEVRKVWIGWLACGQEGKGTDFPSTGHSGHSKGASGGGAASASKSSSNLTSNRAESMEMLSQSDGMKPNGQESKSESPVNEPNEKTAAEAEALLSKSER